MFWEDERINKSRYQTSLVNNANIRLDQLAKTLTERQASGAKRERCCRVHITEENDDKDKLRYNSISKISGQNFHITYS